MNQTRETTYGATPGITTGTPSRFVLVLAVLACGAWSWLEVADADIERGNRAFAAGQYRDALDAYRSVKDTHRRDGRVFYNIGTALYKLAQASQESGERADDRYEQVIAAFQRAAALGELDDDRELSAMAHFGRGNALFGSGDYRGAIDAYKSVLRVDSRHDDARYNLEIALGRIPSDKPNPKAANGVDPGAADRANPASGRDRQPPSSKGPGSGPQSEAIGEQPSQDRRGETNPGGPSDEAQSEARDSDNPANQQSDTRNSRRPDAPSTQTGQTIGRPSDTTAQRESGRSARSHGQSTNEPTRAPSNANLDKKLDGLERMSRDLRHQKLRRSAAHTRRGQPKRDW